MTTITMTPAQAQERIANFDLSTYDGWVAAAKALLSDKPEWVGLVHHSNLGYMVMVDNYLSCLPYEGEDHVHQLDDLSEPDISAWSELHKCWDGETQADCLRVLTAPVFAPIKHQRYAVVPLDQLAGLTPDQVIALDVMPFNSGDLLEGEAIRHHYTTTTDVTLVAEIN